ncbi:MAG: wax ester/triacylglycerol synthase domain-containing protein, partial [Pseudomonadota bacterium]
MEQLSGLDASFLRMESSRTPMHIGGIYLCDAATMGNGFSYQKFKKFLASR